MTRRTERPGCPPCPPCMPGSPGGPGFTGFYDGGGVCVARAFHAAGRRPLGVPHALQHCRGSWTTASPGGTTFAHADGHTFHVVGTTVRAPARPPVPPPPPTAHRCVLAAAATGPARLLPLFFSCWLAGALTPARCAQLYRCTASPAGCGAATTGNQTRRPRRSRRSRPPRSTRSG